MISASSTGAGVLQVEDDGGLNARRYRVPVLRRGFVTPVVLHPRDRSLVENIAAARVDDRGVADRAVGADVDLELNGSLLAKPTRLVGIGWDRMRTRDAAG